MQFSTVVTAALASLALASPAAIKAQASPRSPGLLDGILPLLGLPDEMMADFGRVHDCLGQHKTFRTDYSRADDGVFSITNVDLECCEKARELWAEVPEDQFGQAVFYQPCDGMTVTGLSSMATMFIRGFFDSV